MKTLNLTKQQVDILANQIENHPDGYTVPEMEQVQRVSRALTAATGDYRGAILAVRREFRRTRREITRRPLSPEAQQMAIRALDQQFGAQIEDIIADEGEDVVTVSLEDADFAFALQQWEPGGKRAGDIEYQQNCLAIQTALAGALPAPNESKITEMPKRVERQGGAGVR